MWEQREHQQIGDALRLQPRDGGFDVRALVAHRELDRDVRSEPALQLALHVPAGDDERGAILGPDFFIGLRRFDRAAREDGEVDDAPADRPRCVEHARVHEKLAEIFPHVGDGRGIRRSEVDQQDSGKAGRH